MNAATWILIGEILGMLHRVQDTNPARPVVDPAPVDAPSDVRQITVH